MGNSLTKKKKTFVNHYPNTQEEKENMAQPYMVRPCPNMYCP